MILILVDAPKAPDATGDSDVGEDAMEGLTLADKGEDDDADDVSSDEDELPEPRLDLVEYYCLSEAGEGAMAWEGTLQVNPTTDRQSLYYPLSGI